MKKQFLGRFRKTDPANIMNPENYNRHLEQVEEGDASAQESGYAWFRMMSKNTYKRSLENNKYMQYEYKIKQWFSKIKWRFQQSKTHHIYTCPSCKQKIRVPRGKGKIEIRCPKCGQTFIKKS